MSQPKYCYKVALPLKLNKSLMYSSPSPLKVGESVIVPLKSRQKSAVVLGPALLPPNSSFALKSIIGPDSEKDPIPYPRLQWLKWLADYYQHSLGLVVHLSWPPKGVAVKSPDLHSPDRGKATSEGPASARPGAGVVLTPEQKKSLQEIRAHKGFRVHLLHGVTGSGKTEVFFHLIESAIRLREQALILVPEIALTPQHIKRFSSRFPGKVACFHSGLTQKQKREQWMSVLKGDKTILIGPRSALFCPLPRLAWIIVDEEHESHFKQDEKLKYHGRDSAVMLAKHLNIPIVLASATPSLESWYNAQTGKYLYHSLKKKALGASQESWQIVDMRKERAKNNSLPHWLSEPLYTALKQTLSQKTQSALFLNRRGESSYVFCPACSYAFSCANCDITLTQHQTSHLLCHYCGWRREKPTHCPECGKEDLFAFGVGTATIQKELEELFPTARIMRADRDEVKTHKQWSEMLGLIEKKEVDIVIGTQMIAKGLDFPHLNLVGLILADQGLNWPDFRAGEKSFQLMTQMAGRAGRRTQKGQVIVQAYNVSHPVFSALIRGDYKGFAEQELKQRKKYGYPPFGRLSLIRVQSMFGDRALKTATKLHYQLKQISPLTVLGPAPAPYFRLKNQYRYHLLLKSPLPKVLKQAGQVAEGLKLAPTVKVHINQDPVYML